MSDKESITKEKDQNEELDETTGKIKQQIIEHYANIQSQIDVRTEELLMSLPDALQNAREELLQRIEEEKKKSLAALAPDSQLVKCKNEYYEEFLKLKQEFEQGDSDKRSNLHKRILDLREKVKVLEEFMEDFKNRTLVFEEADKSVYASLIGELVCKDDDEDDDNDAKKEDESTKTSLNEQTAKAKEARA
jgi:hypothetical protein